MEISELKRDFMKSILLSLSLCSILLSSCGGSGSDKNQETSNPPIENQLPVALIGADITTNTGQIITISGEQSADPEGQQITYLWSLTNVDQTALLLVQPDQENVSFSIAEPGEYVLSLTVNDGQTNSIPANIMITVLTNGTLPIANAGVKQHVSHNHTVWLNGSDSTPSGLGVLSYHWQFSLLPVNSNAQLSNINSATPSFIADSIGEYRVKLIVKEGAFDSDADEVIIISESQNSMPVANAGANQHVLINELVQLDGYHSSDADNDNLTYNWQLTVPASSQAFLSSKSIRNPLFTVDVEGEYIATLIVSDKFISSDSDIVIITATTQNSPPSAHAGLDFQVSLNEIIRLDGSASSDPDGTVPNYVWSITSRPNGSHASFDDNTLESPIFTADLAGEYVLGLIVNDGEDESAIDHVVITITNNTSLLLGLVQGKITNSMGVAIADVNLTINGASTSTGDDGWFSYQLQIAQGDSVKIEIIDANMPLASYNSEAITKNPLLINYDFNLNIGTQALPLLQKLNISPWSCFHAEPAEEFVMNFTLTRIEETVFTIDYQQSTVINKRTGGQITLPAQGNYTVSVDDLLISNAISLSNYQESVVYEFHLVDPDIIQTALFGVCGAI